MEANQHNYRNGSLPGVYPLATALTPWQMKAEPIFDSGEALSRGTLFPGLDLPFMNLVNKTLPATPMTELMAIDFVADELELYLDTHADDQEAFELYQTFLALAKEAHERYTSLCGAVRQSDQLGSARYSWLNAPWPWAYPDGKEG